MRSVDRLEDLRPGDLILEGPEGSPGIFLGSQPAPRDDRDRQICRLGLRPGDLVHLTGTPVPAIFLGRIESAARAYGDTRGPEYLFISGTGRLLAERWAVVGRVLLRASDAVG